MKMQSADWNGAVAAAAHVSFTAANAATIRHVAREVESKRGNDQSERPWTKRRHTTH